MDYFEVIKQHFRNHIKIIGKSIQTVSTVGRVRRYNYNN